MLSSILYFLYKTDTIKINSSPKSQKKIFMSKNQNQPTKKRKTHQNLKETHSSNSPDTKYYVLGSLARPINERAMKAGSGPLQGASPSQPRSAGTKDKLLLTTHRHPTQVVTFPGCNTQATCWHTWRFLWS